MNKKKMLWNCIAIELNLRPLVLTATTSTHKLQNKQMKTTHSENYQVPETKKYIILSKITPNKIILHRTCNPMRTSNPKTKNRLTYRDHTILK
jgi:hypothetical protein